MGSVPHSCIRCWCCCCWLLANSNIYWFPDKTIAGDGKRYKDEQILAKRNARERGRVRAVNNAFSRLRLVVPAIAHRNKRVSKVKTLQKAIQYIMDLENLLYLPLNAECLYQHQYHSDL